jgi:formamidopyrimidine-DNA glycosylase
MPELPEVETIRRQLEKELKGFTFVSVTTDNEKMFRPSFNAVSLGIKNKKIISVDRQAKLLIFKLSKGLSLIFHLKLTGRLLVRNQGGVVDEYTHSVFTLAREAKGNKRKSTKELRFCDARKFGFVKLVTDKKEMEQLLSGYGPEPFRDLKLGNFATILKGSSRPIKIVLLDQEKISGIGNIYANDALWLAGVDPRCKSNKITGTKVMRLYKAVLVVLGRGLKYGGASDQWYRQVHGEEGKYQEHFLVYGKQGQKCQRCGAIIKRIEVSGRGTFVCPTCQK